MRRTQKARAPDERRDPVAVKSQRVRKMGGEKKEVSPRIYIFDARSSADIATTFFVFLLLFARSFPLFFFASFFLLSRGS